MKELAYNYLYVTCRRFLELYV